MAGLVDLAAQGAPLFDRHATGASASILRLLRLLCLLRWWRLRRCGLPLLLWRLAPLLSITPTLGRTIAAFIAALFALLTPFLSTATTSLTITLTGKRTGTDNCQQQGHACFTDRVDTHFFFRNAAVILPE